MQAEYLNMPPKAWTLLKIQVSQLSSLLTMTQVLMMKTCIYLKHCLCQNLNWLEPGLAGELECSGLGGPKCSYLGWGHSWGAGLLQKF